MSDSPKYCTARLSRERQEALDRERARRGVERRRAAEEKQRRDRAARVEGQQARRAEMERRCRALQERAGRARVQSRAAGLLSALDAAGRALSAASTEPEVARQRSALDTVQERIVELERDVIAVIARDERTEVVRALQAQAGQVDADLGAHFDAAGARAAARALDELAAQLREGRFEDFDNDRAEAARTVARHAAEVAGRHAHWQAVREQALALGGELASAYRALQREARNCEMPAAQVAALEAAAVALERRLDREAFEETAAAEPALRVELEAATARVEDWLERRARRETVLAALAEALPALGFSVDPRSLSLAVPGEELTVLRAYRAAGGELEVKVGHDPGGGEEIYYDMAGFPHQAEVVGGTKVKTCDELEGLLETLHASVRDQGVELGELDWDGKPPRPAARVGPTPVPAPHVVTNPAGGAG